MNANLCWCNLQVLQVLSSHNDFQSSFLLSLSLAPTRCVSVSCSHSQFLCPSLRVRVSTWNRLNLLKGGALSSAMRVATAHDPAHPVLNEAHLAALDRRLSSIIGNIRQCIEMQGAESTLIEDRMNLPHP